MTRKHKTGRPRSWFLVIAAVGGWLAAQAPALTFAQSVSFSVTDISPGHCGEKLAVADMNRDGKLDVVITEHCGLLPGLYIHPGNGAGGFGAPTFLESSLRGLAIDDLNRDGFPDIATVGDVFLSNGVGGFTKTNQSDLHHSIVIGDVNQDGSPDLVSADYFGTTVSILLNNGAGTFSPATGSPITVGSSPQAVVMGDLNGDGKLDLAVENADNDTVRILLGSGDGTFANATNSPFTLAGLISIPPSATPVALADFNRDGKLDLGIAAEPETVTEGFYLLLGNGDGTFMAHAPGAALSGDFQESVAAADLNGDGNLDLVGIGEDVEFLSVLPGNGNGTFGAEVQIPLGTNIFGATGLSHAIGDFNRDGRPDLVLGEEEGDFLLLLNTTTFTVAGEFALAGAVATGGTDTVHVTAVDVDRDGDLDLATVNLISDNVSILLGNGSGGFTPAVGSPIDVSNAPRVVSSADFDRDGDPDLAVTAADQVWIFFNNGSGGFTTGSFSVSGAHHHEIRDVNRDGKPDLIVAAGSRGVDILLGDGSGEFLPAVGSPVATGASASASELVLGDFNRDGKLDIAVGNSSPNTVAILIGNGAGGFTLDSSIDIGGHSGGGGGGMVVGDLNRDGILDLAVVAVTGDPDNFIAVLIGNGSGGFTAGTSVNVSGHIVSVSIGDLDRNGILDLAVISISPNGVHVLSGNGSGGFTAVTGSPFLASGALSDYAAVADINKDGRLDLAVGNITPDNVSVLLNGANSAPTADPQSVSTDEDTAFLITITASDADSEPLTFQITQPSQGVVTPTSGNMTCTAGLCTTDVTYDPRGSSTLQALQGGQNLRDDFTFTVDDGNRGVNTATVQVTVTGVNDAPVLSPAFAPTLAAINEDDTTNVGTTVLTIIASVGLGNDLITDVDAGAVEGLAVTDVATTNGTWQYSTNGGTTWMAFGAVSDKAAVLLSNAIGNRIRFVPNADFNGSVSFTARAWDATSGANGQTGVDLMLNGGTTAFSTATDSFGLTVNPVNDEPVFTLLVNQTLKVNDKPATPIDPQIVPIGVAPGPATATDETSQVITSVTATVFSETTTGLVTIPLGPLPLTNGVATLTFTPAVNLSGTTTILVTATDNGPVGAPNDNMFRQDFTVTVTNAATGLTLDLRGLPANTFDIVTDNGGPAVSVASGFTAALVERALSQGNYTLRIPAGVGTQTLPVTVGSTDCTLSLR